MAKDFIYRKVDVRALIHFHDGPGGLSVNAERIWSRLLIDEVTTPIPGLVLARRGEMADRCRMSLREFDAAFAELSGTKDPDGTPAPMVCANWPLGVITLPSAPRQPVHRPSSTSTPVEWARFFERSAPKCQEVDDLRDAWRSTLGEMQRESEDRSSRDGIKPVLWLSAFDEQSRGRYAKRSANGSPKISANYSAKPSANHSLTGSPTISQDAGGRRQEGEKPPSRDPPAAVPVAPLTVPPPAPPAPPAPQSTAGMLAKAFERVTQTPCTPTACRPLVESVERAAELRCIPVRDMANQLVDAAASLYGDMRERGVHHGTMTPASLASDPRGSGKYLAEAFEIAAGKRLARVEKPAPESPTPRKSEYPSFTKLPDRSPPPPIPPDLATRIGAEKAS